MRRIITTLTILTAFSTILFAQKVQENSVLHGFNKLDISGGYLDVYLVQSNKHRIEIEGEEMLFNCLDYRVSSGTLVVKMDTDDNEFKRWVRRENPRSLRVTIYSKDFNDIEVSGAVDVVCRDVIKQNYMNIDASGATDLDLDVIADRINVDISGAVDFSIYAKVDKIALECSGASDVEVRGEGREIFIDASGASDVDAGSFESEEAEVEVSGASDCIVNTKYFTNIDKSGAGSVKNKRKRD